MIDTIRLSQRCEMHSALKMRDLGFSTSCGHDDERGCTHAPKWKLNVPARFGKSLPRITWNRAPNMKDYLMAEVSLPKMMFGSNVRMIGSGAEINQGLTMLSNFVSKSALVDFDAVRANVSRVHFCYNFHMPPRDVSDYIQAVSNASIPRTMRTVFENETVRFSNGSRKIQIYDKLREVLAKLPKDEATNEDVLSAAGLLRLETGFEDRRACKNLTKRRGLSNTTGGELLTMSVARPTLDEAIAELGLDEVIEGCETRVVRLLDCYGPERAQVLAGFMLMCDSFGAENVVELGLCKKSTFYDRRRAVQAAGAVLHSNGRRRLPPLRLVIPSERSQVA